MISASPGLWSLFVFKLWILRTIQQLLIKHKIFLIIPIYSGTGPGLEALSGGGGQIMSDPLNLSPLIHKTDCYYRIYPILRRTFSSILGVPQTRVRLRIE